MKKIKRRGLSWLLVMAMVIVRSGTAKRTESKGGGDVV